MYRRLLPLAIGFLAVLAGCQAPMAQPSPEVSIAVEGGNLSVSPERVFVDVRSVMGVDVSPPKRVTVLENDSALGAGNAGDLPRFYRLLELTKRGGLNGTAFERMENGRTYATGFIYILPSPNGEQAGTEWVLAHEFVHYINLKLGRVEQLAAEVGRTTDSRYVRRAIREGSAVYTTDAYLARHSNDTGPMAPMYRRILEAVPPGGIYRYGISRYVFGHRYVASRIDDPASLDTVFENPPITSEQVIHGIPPGQEPPAALNVTVTESEQWSVSGTDRMGEAFLRYALENGVDPAAAASAATGWGVDRLYYLRPDGSGNASYAWVFRWDDQANATDFERTLRDYLDGQGTQQSGYWRLSNVTGAIRTPTDRTTVLLVGNRTVTTKTKVSGRAGGQIRIILPPPATAA